MTLLLLDGRLMLACVCGHDVPTYENCISSSHITCRLEFGLRMMAKEMFDIG